MQTPTKNNKLVQIKIPAPVKDKLDEIFAKDGTTTPQALKMIATQIANSGISPFTTMYYENYTKPVSPELKDHLRTDELESLGLLSDKSETYSTEEELDNAFKKNLGM
ncbi:type II toxin-antitoxin system RelB/DinJ family antitoxin [Limosilactobacillus caecicola]|uniref:type II toxin-antitoxin system RelB/DinJ family antitoxin n=1 Tax=Limosilactobacillus caecicola TaxID=2941332 RepID=UPI0020419ABC|nr:type II toxin-antitoxin system RelB/DinJ family antitoxin [Limosilactobacillus caecicola]